MSVLIITYAHKNRLTDYKPFFDTIKSNADQWWHYLDSTWIVATDHSPETFASLLYPYINTTDFFFVAKLTGEHQGWLPQEAWDWLKDKDYL